MRTDLTPAQLKALNDAARELWGVAYRIAADSGPAADAVKEASSLVLASMTGSRLTPDDRRDVLQGFTTAIGVVIGDNEPREREAGLRLAGMWLSTGLLVGAQDYLIDNETPKGRA